MKPMRVSVTRNLLSEGLARKESVLQRMAKTVRLIALAIFAASFFAGSGARAEPSAVLADFVSETCVLSGGSRANVEAIAAVKGWKKSARPPINAQDPLEVSWEVVTLAGTLTVRVGQSILNDDIVDLCTVVVETGHVSPAALRPELTRRLPLKQETFPDSAKGWDKIVEMYAVQPPAPGDIATQPAPAALLSVYLTPSGVVHSVQVSAAARPPAAAADAAPFADAVHNLCVKTGGTASAMRLEAAAKGWQVILDSKFVTRWRKSTQTPSGAYVFTVERSASSVAPDCSVRGLTPRFTHVQYVSALRKLVNLEQEDVIEKNGQVRWQVFRISPRDTPVTLPAGASRYTIGIRSNHHGVVLKVSFRAR